MIEKNKFTYKLKVFFLIAILIPLPVMAYAMNTYAINEKIIISAGSEILLGKVGRIPVTYKMPPMLVNNTCNKIHLRIPGNNHKNLVQGTIYMTPSAGGGSTAFGFSNFKGDNISVNVSYLPNGVYRVYIQASATAESIDGAIYYKQFFDLS